MMIWTVAKKEKHEDGSGLVRYETSTTNIAIESRKVLIPHANGSGAWLYTSYWLMIPGGYQKEYHRLIDAKEAAEEALREILMEDAE